MIALLGGDENVPTGGASLSQGDADLCFILIGLHDV